MTKEELAQYKKEWSRKNKDKVNALSREYRKNNPEKRKEICQRYRENNKNKAFQYIYDNYEWYLWNSAKSRARKYNLEFAITKEDVHIPEVCPYLGEKLTRIQGKGRQDFNPSIDRIDSTKGYTPDNIEVISDKANRMKNNANIKELIHFSKYILQRYKDLI